MFLLKEIDDLFNDFAKAASAPNNLDAKTKALIALATSISVDCVPCIKSYYKKAIDSGASTGEISEALAISMTVAAGSKRAKYAPIIEALESGR